MGEVVKECIVDDKACETCCPLTLQMEFTDKYSLVNAYNLCLLSILAYDDVKLADMGEPRRLGNETFAFLLNDLKIPGHTGKEELFQAITKKVATKEEAYTAIDGFDIDDPGSKAKDSTECGFAVDKDSAFIFVRGTQPDEARLRHKGLKFFFDPGLGDVEIDMDAQLVDFKEGAGQVHRGFYKQFLALIKSQEFDSFIRDYALSKPNIYVAGHSLGGAVATLVAAYIVEAFGKRPLLYTYGSPRVGTDIFVKHYNNRFKHFRHVNNNDLVPMIPARFMEAGIKTFEYEGEGNAAVDKAKKVAEKQIGKKLKHPVVIIAKGTYTAWKVYNFVGPAYLHHGTLMQIEDLDMMSDPVIYEATSDSVIMREIDKIAAKTPYRARTDIARDMKDNTEQDVNLASAASHGSANYLKNIRQELREFFGLYESNGCIARSMKQCTQTNYAVRYSKLKKHLEMLKRTSDEKIAYFENARNQAAKDYNFLNGSTWYALNKTVGNAKRERDKIKQDIKMLDAMYEKTPSVNALTISGKMVLTDDLKYQLERL